MFWCRKLFLHKLLWMTPRSFGFAGGWQRSLAFHILPLTEQVMHLNAFEASSSAMRRHIGTHRDTPRHTETCPSAPPAISCYSFAPTRWRRSCPYLRNAWACGWRLWLMSCLAWTPSARSTRSTRLTRRFMIRGYPRPWINLKALRREKPDQKDTNKINMKHAPVVSWCIMMYHVRISDTIRLALPSSCRHDLYAYPRHLVPVRLFPHHTGFGPRHSAQVYTLTPLTFWTGP